MNHAATPADIAGAGAGALAVAALLWLWIEARRRYWGAPLWRKRWVKIWNAAVVGVVAAGGVVALLVAAVLALVHMA
jgi:hypothetical protein